MSHGRFISLVGILASLALIALLSIWIQIDLRFSRPCRLFPRTEWTLAKTQPDTFEGHLLDRGNPNRQGIDLFRFQRGDLVRFQIAPDILPGTQVTAGRVVARFDSYENRRILAELEPQLAEAQAELRVAETGDREEVVAQAHSEMEAARAERDRWFSEHRRITALWEEGLSSRAALEEAQAMHLATEARLQAAQHLLLAAQTGEKEAVLSALHARIDLLEQQIQDARIRLEGDRVACPIDGEVVTLQGDSALVRIATLDTLYAVAPVSPSRASRLEPGHLVRVTPLGSPGGAMEGAVVRIDSHAANQAGLSFFWVTVAMPNPERRAAAGLRGTVQFLGEKVSLFDWLSDRLRHAADRTLGA